MSWVPGVVNSRAELEQLLGEHPVQLRPGRKSFGPRVGHPDFCGPVDPRFLRRPGAIRFKRDGSAFFVRLTGTRKAHAKGHFRAIGGGK